MFTDRTKQIALAIVHIFETGKPFGDYAAVAVLNDGAGISYGINQFTHRSGSLLKVVQAYLNSGAAAGIDAMVAALPRLREKTPAAIRELAGNRPLKDALKAAARTPEMQAAQRRVMTESYLQPAIEACEGSHFTLPLSLAVIYDSINHGSYERIRDRVTIDRGGFQSDEAFERAWVKEYVRSRDAWLESVPRLAPTDYRTDFFLREIGRGNWDLRLPLTVQGVKLTDSMFSDSAAVPAGDPAFGDPAGNGPDAIEPDPRPGDPPETESPPNTSIEETQTEAVSTGQTTVAHETKVTTETPKGDPPGAGSTKVTENSFSSKILAGLGGTGALAMAAWGYVTSNPSVVGIGMICVTVIILAIMDRWKKTDVSRMEIHSDPDRKNVT